MEYAIDVADACRERGHPAPSPSPPATSAPSRGVEFYRHMDAANVDLKAFTEDFYQHVTRRPPAAGARHARVPAPRDRRVVRDHQPVIPGHNDCDDELDAMTAWIVEHLGPDVPLHFTAFHPDFKMLDVPRTPPATLDPRPGDRPSPTALRYVYTGNVHDRAGSSTYCPGCGRARRSSATGTRSATTTSPTTAAAGSAARRSPAASTARRGRGVPGASRCGWTPRRGHVAGARSRRGGDASHPDRAVTDTCAPRRRGRARSTPTSPSAVRGTVHRLLAGADVATGVADRRAPKAIVAPHAGYRYSGPVAATAYAAIAPARRDRPPRDHRRARPLRRRSPGSAVPSAARVRHTARPVTVDDDARRQALDVPGVVVDDAAHAGEHSLEVHLPFLMAVLGEVSVLPLLVGRSGAGVLGRRARRAVGRVRDRRRDQHRPQPLPRLRTSPRGSTSRTAEMICRLDPPARRRGVRRGRGRRHAARRPPTPARRRDCSTCATRPTPCGDPARVVGYGAFAMSERRRR